MPYAICFNLNQSKILSSGKGFKVALQILGRKFHKNTKNSSLYSQSLLIFIYKTTVVENHPTTREIRELLRPRSTQTGITVYFYRSTSLMYILEIHRRKFQTWRLMKKLWNLSVISHLVLPQCLSLFLAQNLKIT